MILNDHFCCSGEKRLLRKWSVGRWWWPRPRLASTKVGLDWQGYNSICLQNMFTGFSGIFQHQQPSLWLSGYKLCPTIQFSSGTNSLELMPNCTDLRAQTLKIVLIFDVSHKYCIPRLPTLCLTWLQVGFLPLLKFNNLFHDSQSSRKEFTFSVLL